MALFSEFLVVTLQLKLIHQSGFIGALLMVRFLFIQLSKWPMYLTMLALEGHWKKTMRYGATAYIRTLLRLSALEIFASFGH